MFSYGSGQGSTCGRPNTVVAGPTGESQHKTAQQSFQPLSQKRKYTFPYAIGVVIGLGARRSMNHRCSDHLEPLGSPFPGDLYLSSLMLCSLVNVKRCKAINFVMLAVMTQMVRHAN